MYPPSIRFLNANPAPEQLALIPVSSGSVRIAEFTTVNCGREIPRLWQKRRDQAPPAKTIASHVITPFSVTTAETRPAEVSSPRAAQFVKILVPLRRAPSAMAGTAMKGSARPSSGVNKAPFHGFAPPVTSPSISRLPIIRVLSPAGRALSSNHFCFAARRASVSQR